MSYLALLKIRDRICDYHLIQKAKKYLRSGIKAPEGVKVYTGPRGGRYYKTEDVHAAKGTTPKKRLPAFRKKDDGSVEHRTKEGEHGPGTYKITEKDGEHSLSFHSSSGEVTDLGKHADIRELKKLVDRFKGGEKNEEKPDTYNTHATVIVKNPDTDYERHEIYTTGDEGEMKHRVNQLNNQEGKKAYVITLPEGKKTGDILDESDIKPREYSDVEKEAMAHPEYQKVQEKSEFIRGWKEAKEAVGPHNTPEDVLQGISSDTAWGGDNDYLHGGRMAMRQMLDAQDDEKSVSQVKDQKATVLRRKEAETQQPGLTAKLGKHYTIGWSGNQFQRVEVTDPDTNETSVYDIKIREGTRGKQLFNKTEAKAEAIRLATERKEKGSDAIIQGVSDKMNEQKTKPSAPLTSGDKRHNPDQKKIATGLGETVKQPAKESVAEFGVDTRKNLKAIAEKRSRQDRLSQNRLDISEPKKNLK